MGLINKGYLVQVPFSSVKMFSHVFSDETDAHFHIHEVYRKC